MLDNEQTDYIYSVAAPEGTPQSERASASAQLGAGAQPSAGAGAPAATSASVQPGAGAPASAPASAPEIAAASAAESVSTPQGASENTPRYVVALDTANEVIALGLGSVFPGTARITCVKSTRVAARRASNTRLLEELSALCDEAGIKRSDIVCVACGRGPGSFTGVRIAMATAKGIAHALGVGLIGVSTLDAIAYEVLYQGIRGNIAVVADAMRHEVYPVRYVLSDAPLGQSENTYAQTGTVQRLQADSVLKAEVAAERLAGCGCAIVGDALTKYADLFAPCGEFLNEALWTPTGRGLLLALEAAWQAGEVEVFDAKRHNPSFVLPVYTRLSDAEENERARLQNEAFGTNVTPCQGAEKNLTTGVQGVQEALVRFSPFDAAACVEAAALEERVMGTDAWSAAQFESELGVREGSWWKANDGRSGELIGYAGGRVVDGTFELYKIAVAPQRRNRGVASALAARVLEDARNLGALEVTLEVRAGNKGAIAFYTALGLTLAGNRPRYYSDAEDALLLLGNLNACLACTNARAQAPSCEGSGPRVAGMVIASHEGTCVPPRPCAPDDATPGSGRADAEMCQLGGAPSAHGAGGAGATANFTTPAATAPGTTALDATAADVAAPSSGQAADVVHPLILAIESSCDETAAALIDGTGRLLGDVVASQIDFHARFGGVVPEIASRKHIEAICGVVSACFEDATRTFDGKPISWHDIDAVAATYAPGLVGALVVGVAYAKGAAWACEKPFIGVNHLEGHLYANKLAKGGFTPPAVVSLVSGGNTLLVYVKDWGVYETLGTTIDDAVGEAFDKVAKALGLGYPGGPVISKLAALGNPAAVKFPRAMLHSGDLRFSLSGLKTAVITYINDVRSRGEELNVPDIAASFQAAVIEVQVAKARTALLQTGAPTFCLGGGVAANPALREAYEIMTRDLGVRLVMPPLSACGDNAGMIALVAYDRYLQQKFFPLSADAFAHVNLDDPY